MKYWKEAQNLVHRVPSLSIGTTDKDGSPRVTPIGSLFLTEEGKGFYFEKLPQGIAGKSGSRRQVFHSRSAWRHVVLDKIIIRRKIQRISSLDHDRQSWSTPSMHPGRKEMFRIPFR